MAEEYTCIECENLYDDTDGDTDERMCDKCLDNFSTEEELTDMLDDKKGYLRDPNIRRSSTVHYPDWDMKKKEYIVPPKQRSKK